MISFSEESRIVITCLKRLSPFLALEVQNLGFTITRQFQTGVELVGSIDDCIQLNLKLRCASQVLYSLKCYRVDSVDDLYRNLINYPWENLIPVDEYFSVTSTVDHFMVNNPLFVNVKVKDAIVDRMRRELGKRPDSGSDTSYLVINLYWKNDEAEVFLDTSGESLARHGYRKRPGKAPMLEALAAATILATKWDKQSPFVNPMCGSGTLAIEAALLATNRMPGLYRSNYSFMHVNGYTEAYYQSLCHELKLQIKDASNLKIIATDNSEEAINLARANANEAGVEELLDFEVCAFEATKMPDAPGVVFLNPEYGDRMGEEEKLLPVYKNIGDFLKQKAGGYFGYVFTGNLELAKKIGLKASRRTEFYSAKLDCRLLEYELYEGSRRNRE